MLKMGNVYLNLLENLFFDVIYYIDKFNNFICLSLNSLNKLK